MLLTWTSLLLLALAGMSGAETGNKGWCNFSNELQTVFHLQRYTIHEGKQNWEFKQLKKTYENEISIACNIVVVC